MKRPFFALAAAAFAFTAYSAEAAPTERYVNADTLNCRMEAYPNAGIVAKLKRGTRVTVLREEGAWAIIDTPYCWVSSVYLSEEAVEATDVSDALLSSQSPSRFTSSQNSGATRASKGSSAVNAFASSSSPAKKKKTSTRKRTSLASKKREFNYSPGGCPCSGNNVCIGPRGGRYCITSGGNKRYGV